MSNPLVTHFTRLTKRHAFEWHDDPRKFIDEFLVDNSAPVFTTAHEQDEFKSLLKELKKAFPPRPPGHLLYIMGFIPIKNSKLHITFLGPTTFAKMYQFNEFLLSVKAITQQTHELFVEVNDEIEFLSDAQEPKRVHTLKDNRALERFHIALVKAALSCDGELQEPSFAEAGYLPHITHLPKCKIDTGDTFVIDRITISHHPGARLNVSSARALEALPLLKATL